MKVITCPCFCDLSLFKVMCTFLSRVGEPWPWSFRPLMMEIPTQGRAMKGVGCLDPPDPLCHVGLRRLSEAGSGGALVRDAVFYPGLPCIGWVTMDRPPDLSEPPISKLGWHRSQPWSLRVIRVRIRGDTVQPECWAQCLVRILWEML